MNILLISEDFALIEMVFNDLKLDFVNLVYCTQDENFINNCKKNDILITFFKPKIGIENDINLLLRAKEANKSLETILIVPNADFLHTANNNKILNLTNIVSIDNFNVVFIKLMINSLGNNIWFKRILDQSPEEISIINEYGKIIYVCDEKNKIFINPLKSIFTDNNVATRCYNEEQKRLVGDYCFNRFELSKDDYENAKIETYQKLEDNCRNCPCKISFKSDSKIRTQHVFFTRGLLSGHKINSPKQKVDLVAFPLKNMNGDKIAIVEICRDLTLQMIAEEEIIEQEKELTWEDRIKRLLASFERMGYKRGRLYLTYQNSNDDSINLRLTDYFGHNDNPQISFFIDKDEPTKIISHNKKPILFKIKTDNPNSGYVKDDVINGLYWVGMNKIDYIDKIYKDIWIDIPLLNGDELIGKVTIDKFKSNHYLPDSYELSVIENYARTIGLIMRSAIQKGKIDRLYELTDKILKLSEIENNVHFELDTILNLYCEKALKLFTFERISIFLLNNSKVLEKKVAFKKDGIESVEIFSTESYSINDKSLISTIFNSGFNCFENEQHDICGEIVSNSIYSIIRTGEDGVKLGIVRGVTQLKKNRYNDKIFDNVDLDFLGMFSYQLANELEKFWLKEHNDDILKDAKHRRFEMEKLREIAYKLSSANTTTNEVNRLGIELEYITNAIQSHMDNTLKKIQNVFVYENLISKKININDFITAKLAVFKQIRFAPKAEMLTLDCNERRLGIVLRNIFENAVKYNLHDTKKPYVEIKQIKTKKGDTNKRIRIVTYSYGLQINRAESRKIYKDKYRIKQHFLHSRYHNIPGTGKGLYYVAQYLKLMNGKISNKSVPDSDAGEFYINSFIITLPLL
ncbi:MAG: ATP-binding protein [Mariniphaga sp.]